MPDLKCSYHFKKGKKKAGRASVPCRPRNHFSTRSVVAVVTVSMTRHLAPKIGRVVNIAAAYVACLFRIWTKWANPARPRRPRRCRSNDAVGRNPVLDPAHERSERIEQGRSGAPTTMPHAWNKKQPREVLGLPGHSGVHGLIPVDRIVRREDSIGVSVIKDHLASVLLETPQVSRTGGHELHRRLLVDSRGFENLWRVGVEVESKDVSLQTG